MLVEIQFAASTSRWQRWQNWRLDWGCATLSPSSSRAAGGTGVENRQCRPASGMEGGGVKRMRRGRGGGSQSSRLLLSLLSVSSATRLLGQAVTAGSGTRSPFHSTDHQNTHPSSVPGSACCVPRVSESVPRAQVLGPCAARAGASPSLRSTSTAAPALSSPVAGSWAAALALHRDQRQRNSLIPGSLCVSAGKIFWVCSVTCE
jgi:hypothetical protein